MLNIYLAYDRIVASGQHIVEFGQQQRKWILTRIEKDNLQNTFKTKSLKPSKINLSVEFFKYLGIRGQYLLMRAYFQHLFKCVTL